MEKEILVCYDIENDKRRRKLRNALKDLGLFSIQKSVMWGLLLPAEIRSAERLLKEYVIEENDKAFVAPVNFSQGKWEFHIGHEDSFSRYLEPFIAV